MSTQTSEFSKQTCIESDFQAAVLESSLKEFIHQFALTGCCLFWQSSQNQTPCQIHYCNEALIQDFLLHLPESAIAGQPDSATQSFEVVQIEAGQFASPYQMYGCLYSQTPEARCYLVCWHSAPLSIHQQYGIQLYAQTLAQPHPPRLLDCPERSLTDVLQHTRHQLRTPLSLMQLYVDLLQSKPVDPRSQEWLRNLQTTVEDMSISLDRWTESNTPIHSPVDRYDLRQLVEQCCQGMQPWIEQKHLTIIYDSQPLWLRINEWKIKQVLQNLLSNAIAFSPVNGQIICCWQSFQTEVVIKICDNGPGLSAEDLRSIGTPFYSRRPGGTGLGLSIARQIILEHQGSLWADNLPTGGAQFCITLPRYS